jgi:hypothetical protein
VLQGLIDSLRQASHRHRASHSGIPRSMCSSSHAYGDGPPSPSPSSGGSFSADAGIPDLAPPVAKGALVFPADREGAPTAPPVRLGANPLSPPTRGRSCQRDRAGGQQDALPADAGMFASTNIMANRGLSRPRWHRGWSDPDHDNEGRHRVLPADVPLFRWSSIVTAMAEGLPCQCGGVSGDALNGVPSRRPPCRRRDVPPGTRRAVRPSCPPRRRGGVPCFA